MLLAAVASKVAFFHREVGVPLSLRDMDYENKNASFGVETIN
jgi:hypothetical protein